jgi:hypothetical protein
VRSLPSGGATPRDRARINRVFRHLTPGNNLENAPTKQHIQPINISNQSTD